MRPLQQQWPRQASASSDPLRTPSHSLEIRCEARFLEQHGRFLTQVSQRDAKEYLSKNSSVPLIPGYAGRDQDPAHLQAEADKIGYPVLIKASAGGGGKGMRIVREKSEYVCPDVNTLHKRELTFLQVQRGPPQMHLGSGALLRLRPLPDRKVHRERQTHRDAGIWRRRNVRQPP
jgi:carbamoyl-phosphate synthase L subunit-like protein